MKPIREKVQLEFTGLVFYENFVVSTPQYDVVLDHPEIEQLTQVCLDFFQGREFVYIANRINSYNVNPTIYLSLNNTKFLMGIAMVCSKNTTFNTANFESKFAKLPFGIFPTLEEAISWAEKILENKKAGL